MGSCRKQCRNRHIGVCNNSLLRTWSCAKNPIPDYSGGTTKPGRLSFVEMFLFCKASVKKMLHVGLVIHFVSYRLTMAAERRVGRIHETQIATLLANWKSKLQATASYDDKLKHTQVTACHMDNSYWRYVGLANTFSRHSPTPSYILSCYRWHALTGVTLILSSKNGEYQLFSRFLSPPFHFQNMSQWRHFYA